MDTINQSAGIDLHRRRFCGAAAKLTSLRVSGVIFSATYSTTLARPLLPMQHMTFAAAGRATIASGAAHFGAQAAPCIFRKIDWGHDNCFWIH